MDSLRLLTFNVRGLKNKRKRQSILNLIKRDKYDITVLQECHITTDEEAAQWELQYGGKLFYSRGTARSLGQIILINKTLMQNAILLYKDRRVIAVQIKYVDRNVTVINAYAPCITTEKIEFYKHLRSIIDDIRSNNETDIILAGDFNSVLDNDKDITSGDKHNTQEVHALQELISTSDLHDIWRLHHNDDKEYTWSRNTPFIARRLDYVFTSSSLLPYSEHSEIMSLPFSDHRAVKLHIKLHTFQKGPSYWKFNKNLLLDSDYTASTRRLLAEIYRELEEQDTLNPHTAWELIKVKIREHTIAYSTNKNKRRKMTEKRLQEQLNDLEKRRSNTIDDPDIDREILKVKAELEIISLSKAQGAQTRARTKFIEEGERNTKYFLSLEKVRAANNTITALKTQDGHTLTDQQGILHEQTQYYTELYKQDDRDYQTDYISDFLGPDVTLPSLTDQEQRSCEGLITDIEATDSLNDMKTGSAPGSDGLTTEFYKFFWLDIKTKLLDSFQYSFEVGHMSHSQKRGIITLIHKGKGLSRDKLANWRPITLLNTDYKILAKIMAKRLNQVIDKLVDNDQCGFIRGRNISTILRTTDDVIAYLNHRHLPGILLAIDYTKAFDTISKRLIQDSLQKFGLGPEFTQWTNTLIMDNESCINHYGWLSEPFSLERGIRQGCPFSPLIFVLAVEILATKIRQGGITGIQIQHNAEILQLKIQQYADDTTLFLRDKEDLDEAMRIVNNFSDISGLKINKGKSEAMWLGLYKHRTDKHHDLKWVTQTKILGIFFSSLKPAKEIESNWTEKIENMKRTIQQWSRRNLSIYGKTIIAKTFIISQFIYVMQAIGLPQHVLVEINTALYTFLWKKKTNNRKAFEKVKRKVLALKTEKGGLNMIDMVTLQTALQLKWISKLSAPGNQKFKYIPRILLSKLGVGLSILYTPCRPEKLIGNIDESPFWKGVLNDWLSFKKNQQLDADALLNLDSVIWNNELFQFKDENLNIQSWKNAGILRLHHILDNNLTLVDYDNIVQQLGHTPNRLFEFNAVLNALERARRRGKLDIDGDLIDTDSPYIIEGTPLQHITVKQFRKLLTPEVSPCSVNFWRRKLDVDVTDTTWGLVHQATKETRLRVLHWKILHNIYPTNILLKKMGLTHTERCNACSTGEKDYIEHFFFHCPQVSPLWREIEKEINARTGKRVTITDKIALMGWEDKHTKSSDKRTINHLIAIGKMCISKYRYGERYNILLILEKDLQLRNHQFTT